MARNMIARGKRGSASPLDNKIKRSHSPEKGEIRISSLQASALLCVFKTRGDVLASLALALAFVFRAVGAAIQIPRSG